LARQVLEERRLQTEQDRAARKLRQGQGQAEAAGAGAGAAHDHCACSTEGGSEYGSDSDYDEDEDFDEEDYDDDDEEEDEDQANVLRRARAAGAVAGTAVARPRHAHSSSAGATAAGSTVAEGAAEAGKHTHTDGPALFHGVDLAPAHRGMQLLLDRARLFGIGAVAASHIQAHAQCDRCGHVIDVHLQGASMSAPAASTGSAGAAASAEESYSSSTRDTGKASAPAAAEHKSWCPRCSLLLTLRLRPTLLHEGSAVLGYVDVAHCTVAGVHALGLLATCLECGQVAEKPHYTPPATWEASCHHCFSRLRLETRVPVRCEVATLENAVARQADPRHLKSGVLQKFTVGKPLPMNGTCKHYGRSYRWLRFPCCGVAFPCDTCHDESSDHPAEWASRQICGWCAREQPLLKGMPCSSCGKFTTSAARFTRHWEGGTGQRNKRLLSKRDPKKYTGSKNKTVSNRKRRLTAIKEGHK
jgi:uncharacterized CHY-type Zn-finger protein